MTPDTKNWWNILRNVTWWKIHILDKEDHTKEKWFSLPWSEVYCIEVQMASSWNCIINITGKISDPVQQSPYTFLWRSISALYWGSPCKSLFEYNKILEQVGISRSASYFQLYLPMTFNNNCMQKWERVLLYIIIPTLRPDNLADILTECFSQVKVMIK